MRILITGGAGFVGSSLARSFKRTYPHAEVCAFDNLKRRGSELNLAAFKKQGIKFVHGDIRQLADLKELDGSFDVFVEASAEPSVLAGLSGSVDYLIQTNLAGTVNCLEYARRSAGTLLFLSTSRVYSIDPLRQIPLVEQESRLEVQADHKGQGISLAGISEAFPVDSFRSLYGATKLCSEYLIQEYCQNFGMNAVINRCGVIAGPGQFGKVDQGVFTLWVAHHYFGKALRYTGFGGTGKQVRDLLHPDDLFRLLQLEIESIGKVSGRTFNCGGGRSVSTSLLELTKLCESVVGKSVDMGSQAESASVDIPYYVSDYRLVEKELGWRPEVSIEAIVKDIHHWIRANESDLRSIFDA